MAALHPCFAPSPGASCGPGTVPGAEHGTMSKVAQCLETQTVKGRALRSTVGVQSAVVHREGAPVSALRAGVGSGQPSQRSATQVEM